MQRASRPWSSSGCTAARCCTPRRCRPRTETSTSPWQSDTWVPGGTHAPCAFDLCACHSPNRCASNRLSCFATFEPTPPPPPPLPLPLPPGTAAGFFKSPGCPQLQTRQGRPVAAGALACRGRAGPAGPPRVPATWPAAAAAAGLIALCDPWLLPDILASLLAPRGYCLPCVATAFPTCCLPSVDAEYPW